MRNPTSARPDRLALSAVSAQLGIMFVGAILPTPLYPLYREAFGFSGVTLTLIYATYVLGNLAALLFFGRLAGSGSRNHQRRCVCRGAKHRVAVCRARVERLFDRPGERRRHRLDRRTLCRP